MKRKILSSLLLAATLGIGMNTNAQCENVNGDFESFTGPMVSNNNDWYNANLDNWFVSHGTPTFSAVPTHNTWMWSYNGIGEGIYTNYNFIAGNTYTLTYRLWRNTDANPASVVRVSITNGLTAAPSGVPIGSVPPTPAGPTQPLTTQDYVSGGLGSWVTITETFTATSAATQLWFYPFLAGGPTPGPAEAQIDDVCIVDVSVVDPCSFEPNFDIRENGCGFSFSALPSFPMGLNLLKVTWDYGDGTTGEGGYTEHYYTTAGTYNVCMTMWVVNEDGECCKRTLCKEIKVGDCDPCEEIVRAELLASISADNPNTFIFDIGGLVPGLSDVLGYEWDFGDGSSSFVGPQATHTYAGGGRYTVCVTLYYFNEKEKACCSHTVCIEIVVEGDAVEDEVEPDLGRGKVYMNTEEAIEQVMADSLGASIAQPVISPNPNNGEFNLSTPNGGQIENITVYNLQGGVVYQSNGSVNQENLRMDLKHLERGTYFILVNDNQSKKYYSKVVLQ